MTPLHYRFPTDDEGWQSNLGQEYAHRLRELAKAVDNARKFYLQNIGDIAFFRRRVRTLWDMSLFGEGRLLAIGGGNKVSSEFKRFLFEIIAHKSQKRLRRIFGYELIPEASAMACSIMNGDCGRPPAFLFALSKRGPLPDKKYPAQLREYWFERLVPHLESRFHGNASRGELKDPARSVHCMQLLATAAENCSVAPAANAPHSSQTAGGRHRSEQETFALLTDAQQLAWGQYLTAERELGNGITDRAAWNWVIENLDNLPASQRKTPKQFETWTKHLQNPREKFGKSKRRSTAGRTGRSVVDRNELE